MLEDVDEVLETKRNEEEPPINDEIQPIETLVESESATSFKDFEALHNIVLHINDRLLRSHVQTETGHMYDEQSDIEMSNDHKKIMHSWQMTLPHMFKQ